METVEAILFHMVRDMKQTPTPSQLMECYKKTLQDQVEYHKYQAKLWKQGDYGCVDLIKSGVHENQAFYILNMLESSK